MPTALVLSGGGMFGAWQAGAWSALARSLQPDLIVGTSVGSLNGYLIACGMSPEELCRNWLDPRFSRLPDLRENVKLLTAAFQPRISLAVTATDLFRLKPKAFHNATIGWQHLTASCAIPLILPHVTIDGRVYVDGGLVNPIPVWAAVEVGATRIVVLDIVPKAPAPLRPLIRAFRWLTWRNPPVPPGVQLDILKPSRQLGSLLDAVRWRRSNIERWLELGASDARDSS